MKKNDLLISHELVPTKESQLDRLSLMLDDRGLVGLLGDSTRQGVAVRLGTANKRARARCPFCVSGPTL